MIAQLSNGYTALFNSLEDWDEIARRMQCHATFDRCDTYCDGKAGNSYKLIFEYPPDASSRSIRMAVELITDQGRVIGWVPIDDLAEAIDTYETSAEIGRI